MTTLPDLNALPLAEFYKFVASTGLVRRVIELAHDEDLGPSGGPGDITTRTWFPQGGSERAALVCRAGGVVSGLRGLPELIRAFGPAIEWTPLVSDGGTADAGQPVARFEGDAAQLLALERTMLNLVGRLSGVATLTAKYAAAVRAADPAGRCHVYDTRKTTPGLRVLEKYAVRCGGGRCHRLGLHDAVLLKDNHLVGLTPEAIAERLTDASRRARAAAPLRFFEVEVDSLTQLEAVLRVEPGVVDIVLLDNMRPSILREAVALRDRLAPRVELEASGGVTLATIGEIARAGVERISAGAMTHQAVWLDVALDAD